MKSLGYECKPMINKHPPFKGLNIRIPTIIPIKVRGVIEQGSTLKLSSHWFLVREKELCALNPKPLTCSCLSWFLL